MATVLNDELLGTRRRVTWTWVDAQARVYGPNISYCDANTTAATLVALLEQRDMDAQAEAEMQRNLQEIGGG